MTNTPIQPQELRIGNIIFNGTITEIGKDYFKFFDGYQTWNRKDMVEGSVEPIPITEDWLLKFGFHKIPHFTIGNSIIKNIGRERYLSISDVGTCNQMFWLCSKDEDSLKYTDLICLHNWDYDKDLYVHQLQNLYHAITGKELTLQE